jgi:hypothetical protein
MMKRLFSSVLLVLAATSCATNVETNVEPSNGAAARIAPVSTEPVATVAPASTAVANDPDGSDVICRRQIVSGSHFQRRVCTTREERAAMQESAEELLRDVARETAFVGGGNSE